ncbi:uncharacterized protein I303_108329 [Kwoniella dejecticola CBS 10117]|uniref:Zn(2)-C6 fungal-type domain-containing protein n=1 Tax=Kwoniella dejecticola CBS 10117 TaxID=1296121 RepID=A0A1A5ZXP7_9TREE|nr:uncharacterized protein I303_07344 [Kwoniella dejecticola CBS 10117]OBR82582.1 hypothetical protein I303_07344 [Kwoniella dejecticola CBS 10117]
MSDTSEKAEKEVHPDVPAVQQQDKQTTPSADIIAPATDATSEEDKQDKAVDNMEVRDGRAADRASNASEERSAIAGTQQGEAESRVISQQPGNDGIQDASKRQEGTQSSEENANGHDQQAESAPLADHGLSLDDEEGFDPATLANLAALSRIIGEDDNDIDGQMDGEGEGEGDQGQGEDALEVDDAKHDGPLTREQVQAFVKNLSHRDKKEGSKDDGAPGEEEEGDEANQKEKDDDKGRESDNEELREISEDEKETKKKSGVEDEEYEGDNKPDEDDGKRKRKRNRTVLSCTECHRRKQHCDRNIPCSRCIKRGVPGMCRMEHPVLPQRKKRKVEDDEDINYELGLRVQALESLLRSGSLMDADQASVAARETIMHATRAANAGSQDANNALAQLTQSVAAGGGIGGLSQDAQSSLLLDVLQQLTAASMGKSLNTGGPAEGLNRRGLDVWSAVPTASQETSVAIASAYENDDLPTKINLSLPGFREDNGKIFIPPTVRYVEKNLRNENILAREALPIEGYAPFLDAGVKFAYGAESQAYRHKRIAAIQGFSLTGALRLAATFLSRFPPIPATKTIFVPSPTADEDTKALQDAGLEIRSFRFLDYKTGSVDWDGLRADLQDAPLKSIVLLQVSGSMPSGAELTTNQWRLLAALLQERGLIPLVMMAFQGLSTGDTNRDAQALRFMVHEGLPVVLVQSFDAMMGIYADSPAIVSIITQNVEDRDRVDSQLRSVARGMWFHPSPWGAQVAHQILSDAKLYPAWLAEIKAMSDRLRSVREKLYDLLANKLKTPGSWIHLKRASGMYCTALLPPSQAEALTSRRHVHLLPDGCFNLGCLNALKIDFLAKAIDNVVREGIKEMEEQQAQRMAMEIALAAAKEQQLREEEEAAKLAELAEQQAAREEDTLLMEASIANAIERQRLAEEEEEALKAHHQRNDDAYRRQLERAEIAKQAEAILATLHHPNPNHHHHHHQS